MTERWMCQEERQTNTTIERMMSRSTDRRNNRQNDWLTEHWMDRMAR